MRRAFGVRDCRGVQRHYGVTEDRPYIAFFSPRYIHPALSEVIDPALLEL